jgi:hypothetical protein
MSNSVKDLTDDIDVKELVNMSMSSLNGENEFI